MTTATASKAAVPAYKVLRLSESGLVSPEFERMKASESIALAKGIALRVVEFDEKLPCVGIAAFPATQSGPSREQIERLYRNTKQGPSPLMSADMKGRA